MATINWTITGSTSDISSSVSGTFEVTTTTNPVDVEIPTAVTISSPKQGVNSFLPVDFATFDDGIGNGQYSTWRSTNPPAAQYGQYPVSGVSFDVWSPSLSAAISGGDSWADLVSTGSFSLEPLKNTVFYNYDTPDATWYGKGGTITFS